MPVAYKLSEMSVFVLSFFNTSALMCVLTDKNISFLSFIVATISFSRLEYTVIENEERVGVELVRSGDVFREAVVLIGTNPYKGSAMGK